MILNAFYYCPGKKRIEFFHFDCSDGVGDGQFGLCKEFEFPQIKTACRLIEDNYNPKVTFIIVQKRVNARIFSVISSFFSRHVQNVTFVIFSQFLIAQIIGVHLGW